MSFPYSSQAKKAFQRMWVAGTLGAYFAALVRSIPIDVQAAAGSDVALNFHQVIRYGYILWLLGYFFVTNFSTEMDEQPTAREILFDVFQSVVGLAAAFELGLVVTGRGVGLGDISQIVMVGSTAVVLIALVAAVMFRTVGKIQQLRWFGVGLGGASLVLSPMFMNPITVLAIGAILLLGLWVVLYKYFRLRLQVPFK